MPEVRVLVSDLTRTNPEAGENVFRQTLGA